MDRHRSDGVCGVGHLGKVVHMRVGGLVAITRTGLVVSVPLARELVSAGVGEGHGLHHLVLGIGGIASPHGNHGISIEVVTLAKLPTSVIGL